LKRLGRRFAALPKNPQASGAKAGMIAITSYLGNQQFISALLKFAKTAASVQRRNLAKMGNMEERQKQGNYLFPGEGYEARYFRAST